MSKTIAWTSIIYRPFWLGIIALLWLISSPAWALCNNPVLSPSSVVSNPAGGSGGPSEIITAINVSVTCNTRNETFTLTVDASSFTSMIGSDPQLRVKMIFYKDAAKQSDIFNSTPITGKHTSGTVGTVTITIYAVLNGQYLGNDGIWTDGFFLGNGNFNVTGRGKITSGSTVSAFTFNQSGTVVASCSVNSPSVDFGTFQSGTKPEAPVKLSVLCSQGTTYRISQPSATPVVISGQTRGYAYVIAPSGTPLVDQTITTRASLGFPIADDYQSKIRLEGLTRGSPIVGAGSFTTVIPVLVSY
jgi:hypothetical protein